METWTELGPGGSPSPAPLRRLTPSGSRSAAPGLLHPSAALAAGQVVGSAHRRQLRLVGREALCSVGSLGRDPGGRTRPGGGGAAPFAGRRFGGGGVGGGSRRPGFVKTWELTSPEKFQTWLRAAAHAHPGSWGSPHLTPSPKQRTPLRPGRGGFARGHGANRPKNLVRPLPHFSFTFIVIVPAGSGKGRNSAPPSAPPS